MCDNSSSASESDNTLLTVNDHSRISRNAATQTPELPRHTTQANCTDACEKTLSPSSSSSVVVLRVDNHTSASDLENEAKALAIPDVVVEYIKDSCGLKDLGVSNPGFNSEEGLHRVPCTISLRDDSKNTSSSEVGSTTLLHPGLGSSQNRMYHSMPRKMQKKFQDELKIHSQPCTPKLHRAVGTDSNDLASSSYYLRPGGSTPFSSVPPSPNFGYRPLESETSAVYTITRTFIDNAGGIVDSSEVHLLPSLQVSEKSTPRSIRKFEYTPAPENIERRRRYLQFFTDTLSLLFILPGLFLAIFTPVFIVPMLYFPMSYFLQFLGFFVASGSLSVVILALSGLIGNVVWHYDEKSKGLKLKLHCGRGPLRFFWGNGFYELKQKSQPKKEITV